MEDLFSTSVAVNNENINYRVVFDQEQYVFISETDNKSFPRFSLVREHDEWKDGDKLPPELKTQAVDALEKYLLRQH